MWCRKVGRTHKGKLFAVILRVAEQCFLDGELAETMKESITRLIFKKRGVLSI